MTTVQFLPKATKRQLNFFGSRGMWRLLRAYSFNNYNHLKLISEILRRNFLSSFQHLWRGLLFFNQHLSS